MALDELTITLSDPDGRVSVETLTEALENALDMLRSVASDIVQTGVRVRWEVVRVRMRSPLRLTFAPRITGTRSAKSLRRKVVKACLDGIRGIEKEAVTPPHFDEEALKATRKLATPREGVALTFSSNGSEKITLTKNTIQHVDEIASKAHLYMGFSTIEGYLEIVSVHDRKSFFIWETLTNHRVECIGTDEQFDKAYSLLKERPRLSVTGRVHFRNHVPKLVDVESIEVLPNSGPSPREMGPINITDGLSSEEHVRRIRN